MSEVKVLDAHKLWKDLTEGWIGWIFYGLLGIVFAVLLMQGSGLVLGNNFPIVTVSSKSMVPTLNVGDVVFVKSEDEYEPGEIIVFNGWRSQPIIHRVVAVISEGEVKKYKNFDIKNSKLLNSVKGFDNYKSKLYITKGDHNERYDQHYGVSPVGQEDIYGKKVFVIPYLGLFKVGLVKMFSAIL